jgi:hypothetical protein
VGIVADVKTSDGIHHAITPVVNAAQTIYDQVNYVVDRISQLPPTQNVTGYAEPYLNLAQETIQLGKNFNHQVQTVNDVRRIVVYVTLIVAPVTLFIAILGGLMGKPKLIFM